MRNKWATDSERASYFSNPSQLKSSERKHDLRNSMLTMSFPEVTTNVMDSAAQSFGFRPRSIYFLRAFQDTHQKSLFCRTFFLESRDEESWTFGRAGRGVRKKRAGTGGNVRYLGSFEWSLCWINRKINWKINIQTCIVDTLGVRFGHPVSWHPAGFKVQLHSPWSIVLKAIFPAQPGTQDLTFPDILM